MNVQATAEGDGVTVTWDAPLFMGGASSVTYRVYKGDSLIATDLTTTEFEDEGVGERTMAYEVSAVNDAGESAANAGQCAWIVGADVGGCVELAWEIVWWVIGQLPP